MDSGVFLAVDVFTGVVAEGEPAVVFKRAAFENSDAGKGEAVERFDGIDQDSCQMCHDIFSDEFRRKRRAVCDG